MRIHAYVLAADPTWLRSSVLSYYSIVDRIVVCFDEEHQGWTGAPIDVDSCLTALRQIDVDNKVTLLGGRFRATTGDLLGAETAQRTAALAVAGKGADWVLQLDGDEILPDTGPLLAALEEATKRELVAVEWPMRVLYRKTLYGRYLQVATRTGAPHYEYPGPIAVRPGTRLVDARRTDSAFLRMAVAEDTGSLQLQRPTAPGETRLPTLAPDQSIWHNSWARSPRVLRRKLGSWGHSNGARTWAYYYAVWLPAPLTWRFLRNLHPFARGLWPRLTLVADALPPVHSEEGSH